jgi:hypothetical protein
MRWLFVLVIDGLLALPRFAYTLAVYFWMRVLGGAADPEAVRRRAVRWTWITLLSGVVLVVLWVILANTVKL